MTTVDWNAVAYDDLSDPMFEWGLAVLETVPLRGDETVLDAGCGSGRLTEELVRRLPNGHVIALDFSPAMLQQTRARFAANPRVSYFEASLESFELAHPVDGIFSNAVLHWVPDHASMFRSLHAALRPKGFLVAQFGGQGNLQNTLTWAAEIAEQPPFCQYISGARGGQHFEDEPSTVARMKAAGFTQIESRMHQVFPRFERRERFEAFAGTVILRNIMAGLPEALRPEFLHLLSQRALAAHGAYVYDYVRHTVRARA
jgi:trans-aconitate 2-methyltransferase